MYENISRGMKISISSSIKKSFLNFMERIDWDDSKYDSDKFIQYWMNHSKENAAWFKDLDKNFFDSETFQAQLVDKVNEIIQKVIETEPTEEQMTELDSLVKQLDIGDVDYCCKDEAQYHIKKLKKKLDESR